MKKYAMIFLIFLVLSATLTFPLFTGFNRYIPGSFSTDEPFAHLWNSWQMKFNLLHGGKKTTAPLITYPFGNGAATPGFFSLWNVIDKGLSLATTPALTFNLQVIFNFLAAAFITYLLAFCLMRESLSAVISAVIFSFCPYMFVRAWQHLGLTYNELIPLVLLAAISLREKPSGRTKLFFFISLFLLFSFDYSIAYLGLVAFALFIAYVFFYAWAAHIKNRGRVLGDSEYLKNIAIISGICLILVLFQVFPFIRDTLKFSSLTAPSAHNSYRRPFEDLFAQSARPLSYLLPPSTHPLFGGFTQQLIGSSLYGISLTEHALYLGWVPLILAFMAFWRWRKRREQSRENFYIGFFLFLGVVAWLFSQPPWWNIGPFKIYMPSFFMYKILPMFRAYCRFGIVLMLAVAVLAGFGLKFILGRFKSQKLKAAIAVLFCGAVLFEFWNWPPYKVIDVSRFPEVYSWLKTQPADTVIAEYPLDAGSPNEMYKFYQTRHEKKIINGSQPGTHAHKVAQEIIELSSPNTAGILKWMGVRYVLVHENEYLDSGLIDDRRELSLISSNPALRLVKEFPAQACPRQDIMCIQKTGPVDVYEVIAAPIQPRAKE